MRISTLAGLAAAAVLAGASMAPTFANVIHRGGVQMDISRFHAVPGKAGALVGRHPLANQFARSWSHPIADKKAGCIYVSDNLSGVITYYSTSSPSTPAGTLTSSSLYGWGVVASKKGIYAGTYSDTVTGYSPCSNSPNGYHATGGGHGGYPYGMAVDSQGNLWADEWPTNFIDWWGPSGGTVAGSGADPNQPLVYFLALDKSDNVYPAGYNNAESAMIVDRCASNITGCTTIITLSGAFPGGDAIDKSGNVYVNDQFGTVHSFACSTTCTQTGSYTYSNGNNPLDYTAIFLDKKAKNLWGANIYFCSSSYGLCGDAQSQSLPLSTATLNGNTGQLANAEPLGAAIWKPAKP